MLRIGDFSQLAQVSVPTLRHYDELGLLKPAQVDKFTDYRYYSIDQLSRSLGGPDPRVALVRSRI